jgi:hypothetical protein
VHTAVVAVGEGQSVQVTSTKALGAGGVAANLLDLWICFRAVGSAAAPTKVGLGMLDHDVPANTRVQMTLSAAFTPLAPGNYNVGLCGSSPSANWSNNEFGYTTALVFTSTAPVLVTSSERR